METFEQADSGYPEEGPPGAAPGERSGESAVRERARPDDEAERAPDNDDGKPHTAG